MWCNLRYVIYVTIILQYYLLQITADDIIFRIDTQSYGEKAIYPKRACYHGFVYNFIKDFYRYMSIDYIFDWSYRD